MMEKEEGTDQQNTRENRSSGENEEKISEKADNQWGNDFFDETDPNLDEARKDPKGTLFY